ncbi:MAG: hypothetical protein Q9220_001832 [cf. Caloplaca sp. 1 TL-2023]
MAPPLPPERHLHIENRSYSSVFSALPFHLTEAHFRKNFTLTWEGHTKFTILEAHEDQAERKIQMEEMDPGFQDEIDNLLGIAEKYDGQHFTSKNHIRNAMNLMGEALASKELSNAFFPLTWDKLDNRGPHYRSNIISAFRALVKRLQNQGMDDADFALLKQTAKFSREILNSLLDFTFAHTKMRSCIEMTYPNFQGASAEAAEILKRTK